MYIIRDIFHLKFGHFRDAKALMDEAKSKNMMPNAQNMRVLSDFTGDAYRLIMEEGFDTLEAFEKSMASTMNKGDWKDWYERFKPHIERSHREILKQVL
jgi:hypothetical protein